MSLLRARGGQGRRLAREQGGRGHPPPARVPRLRQALHVLRAHRPDPAPRGQEGRATQALRPREAAGRPHGGVREAAGADQGARVRGGPGRGDGPGEPRPRGADRAGRGVPDGTAARAGQGGLRPLRIGLPRVQGRRPVHGHAEGPARNAGIVAFRKSAPAVLEAELRYVSPTWIVSPSVSGWRVTRRSLTNVPLVLFRSWSTNPPFSGRMR